MDIMAPHGIHVARKLSLTLLTIEVDRYRILIGYWRRKWECQSLSGQIQEIQDCPIGWKS